MASDNEPEQEVQEGENDPSDHASRDNPLPSHRSSGADLSARRSSPEDVFPRGRFIRYLSNNHFVDLDRIRIHPIILSILRGHPLRYALSARHDVPEVYVQQAWHTIRKIENVTPPRFVIEIDQYETFLDYKRLRLILRLPEAKSRPGFTEFEDFPSEEEVLAGIRDLGYVGELTKVSDFEKNKLPPAWYALISVIIRCLTAKHSGTDNASLHFLRLFHAVIHDLHVDYALIFWTELSEIVNSKLTNKHRSFLPCIRFLELIVWSMLRSNKEIPRRNNWPTAPDYEMGYINRQKRTFNYSMPIPPTLIQKYVDPEDDAVVSYCEEHGIELQPRNDQDETVQEEE